jgi:hypothetical protein
MRTTDRRLARAKLASERASKRSAAAWHRVLEATPEKQTLAKADATLGKAAARARRARQTLAKAQARAARARDWEAYAELRAASAMIDCEDAYRTKMEASGALERLILAGPQAWEDKAGPTPEAKALAKARAEAQRKWNELRAIQVSEAEVTEAKRLP